MRTAIAAFAAFLMASPAMAQETDNPLDHFAPLLGSCYEDGSPDVTGIDRHCWSRMDDGQSIRQTHVITGGSLDGYTGEAIYRFDPDTGVASFIYRSSGGDLSRGTVVLEDGLLVFPDEVYRRTDGSKTRMESTFEIHGADHYSSRFREQFDGQWTGEFAYEFRRVEGVSAEQ